jgi:hypothetical protein
VRHAEANLNATVDESTADTPQPSRDSSSSKENPARQLLDHLSLTNLAVLTKANPFATDPPSGEAVNRREGTRLRFHNPTTAKAATGVSEHPQSAKERDPTETNGI